MSAPLNPNAKINLERATALVIERNQHGLDILSQILKGFGVNEILRCTSIKEAQSVLQRKAIDLLVMDPDLNDEDGLDLVRWLRRCNLEPNRFTSVLLVTGYAAARRVKAARDCGANFVVAKPLMPTKVLERIMWLARERRAFVEDDTFVGPDRRFKFEGPPSGTLGRRRSDKTDPIGDATEPNMSQVEIDALLKPQRVQL